jgi:hypothetical protein
MIEGERLGGLGGFKLRGLGVRVRVMEWVRLGGLRDLNFFF